jgi:hypothetical protein
MQRRIVNLHIQVFLLDIVFEEVVLVCDRDVPVAQDCDRGGGVVRVRVIADEEVAPGEVPRGIIRPMTLCLTKDGPLAFARAVDEQS